MRIQDPTDHDPQLEDQGRDRAQDRDHDRVRAQDLGRPPLPDRQDLGAVLGVVTAESLEVAVLPIKN